MDNLVDTTRQDASKAANKGTVYLKDKPSIAAGRFPTESLLDAFELMLSGELIMTLHGVLVMQPDGKGLLVPWGNVAWVEYEAP